MAVIVEQKGLGGTQEILLPGEISVLGRHSDCDVVLDVGAVSRHHAQITQVGADFFVEDLNSRNGTFLNGEQVRGRLKLADNDEIRICGLTYRFYHDTAPTSPPLSLDGSSSLAMFVEDQTEDTSTGQSTIMSALEVEASEGGIRLSVNSETKLKALIEINRNLSTLSLDEVLPKLLDSLFKIFIQADRGFVALKTGEDQQLVPKAIKHRRGGDEDMIRISRTIVEKVMGQKEAILSADATSDSRFNMAQSIADFRIRSMMCAPLVTSEGDVLGVIQIDTNDQGGRFQKDDLEVLASVGAQAAMLVESAQLHETALRQNRIERDLALAQRVQQGLLPNARPKVEGYHFFEYYEPANEVGGDFYDYVPLPGGRVAVVLADVSGKGISAALLMAKLSGEARFLLASKEAPEDAITAINAAMDNDSWEDRFVTFVLAVIDPAENRVTIVNGGHMPPLLRRADGSVSAVSDDEAGPPLGVAFDYEYEACHISLAPGEQLVVFTDGFSEAMNESLDLYGLERLEKAVGCDLADPASLGAYILEDVRRFVSGHRQSDDMCLVCFGRDG
ncbi:MAG: SpoIIE family protein phosphatase [Pirellulales bacterium]|nr:SpoIIE family protein phosphatase [Pirellulales bacterium]